MSDGCGGADAARDLFLWAATVLSSRSFPGRLIPDAGDHPVVFPLLDALNHRPRARITWVPGADALSFATVDATPAGVEIFNNYGAKGNEERTPPSLYPRV